DSMRIAVIALAVTALVSCSRGRYESLFASGERYFAARQYAEAAIQFENATRARPDAVAAYMKLGETYLLMNQPRYAAGAYQRACGLDRVKPEPCMRAADVALRIKDYDAALAAARAALAADPHGAQTNLVMGRVFAGLLRFTEAERYLKAAV